MEQRVNSKNLCWRVGDGQSISIKCDAWIPRIPGFQCKWCALSSEDQRTVNLMITGGEWNEVAVRQLFPFFEAEAILNIQLST